MSILYLRDQGAIVHKQGERLVVKKGKETLYDIPCIHVQQVVIFGNVILTTQVLNFLMEKGIDASFLTVYGRYRGRLQPPLPGNIELRQAQYLKAMDEKFCQQTARQLILGKIYNSLEFLVRQRESERIQPNLEKILSSAEDIEGHPEIGKENLLGYEGTTAHLYFSAFGEMIKNKGFTFSRRIKHPPPDPVNIMLSLGYTLLFNSVHALVNMVGLDPYRGFMHECRSGHATIVSDLIEEYRALVVDSMVLRMLNTQMISLDDFYKGKDKWILKPKGLQKYLETYTKKINTVLVYQPTGEHLSYQQCMEKQVRLFARVLLGQEDKYQPFQVAK